MAFPNAEKMPDRNLPGEERISWPPLRSDLLAICCLLIDAYCLLEHTWPLVLLAALCAAIICGLAPRLEGTWRLRVWGAELRACFRGED